MKKVTITTALMAALIIATLSGCANLAPAEITYMPTSKPSITLSVTPSAAPVEICILDSRAAEAPLLDNAATLKDIAGFLNRGTNELLEQYEEQLEWVRSNFPYDEYYDKELGVTIVCYSPGDSSPPQEGIAKYIELDDDEIILGGIDASMNFTQVMNLLGKAKIHKLEDGLPGLMTYELRYMYEGIKLRIYSWDMNGNGGIYASIVDEFVPEYRPIRITPEQITHYFDLSFEDLKMELGEDDSKMPSMSPHLKMYSKYGAEFRYNDEDEKQLLTIRLDSRYQINILKNGIRLKDTMSIMGETEVKEYYLYDEEAPSDDGLHYEILYEFDNFEIEITNHGYYDDWRAYWDIKTNDLTYSKYFDYPHKLFVSPTTPLCLP
jgi:hypothetical protein